MSYYIDEELEGRIIALELLAAGWLTHLARQSGADPITAIATYERTMFETTQHLDRPIDDRADRVWGHAVSALKRRFAQARHRIEFHQGRAGRP